MYYSSLRPCFARAYDGFSLAGQHAGHEGYHLRSQSVPFEEARTSTEGPSTLSTSHMLPLKGLKRGWCRKATVLWQFPLAMGTQDTQATLTE